MLSLLQEAWALIKRQPQYALVGSVLPGSLLYALSLTIPKSPDSWNRYIFLWCVGIFTLDIVVYFWKTNYLLKAMDHLQNKSTPPDLKSFFIFEMRLISFTTSSLIAALLAELATLCLIIPGVWLYTRLLFLPYVLIDQDKGIWGSIAHTYSLTRGHFRQLLPLSLLSCAGIITSIIPTPLHHVSFILLLLFLFPILDYSIVIFYRKISPSLVTENKS